MRVKDCAHGFEFDHHRSIDQQIKPVDTDYLPLVANEDLQLPLIGNAPSGQLHLERPLIDPLHEPGTQGISDGQCRPDYMT